jgi:CTP:molybdopterin cytidylyltransferase MocA
MTVAAVILSATTEGALADTLGQPRVRRLVDIAWSGGALPVVVVAPDPEGAIAAAIVGSEAVYGTPAPPEAGPAGQMLRGAEVARAEVSDITGVLLWPGRMTWVGPETITSLIEAHGVAPGSLLRPGWQGEVGWPVLLPISAVEHLRAVSSERMPADIVDEVAGYVTTQVVDVGDPGIHFDADTPIGELPPYEGPPEPPGGHRHEWGDAVAEGGVDEAIPGEGRGLAPYPQAADDAAVDLD